MLCYLVHRWPHPLSSDGPWVWPQSPAARGPGGKSPVLPELRWPTWLWRGVEGPFICTCVSLSLRSHRDTLHTFPRDRPDPKTLDQGRPLRGGACPPGLSLHSHPPSD
uniref:Uncharacterized protein n=2 Tax=Canis lupus familiaris TaxID=9615 RepID=A0A8C0MIK4_CANLF